MRPVLLVCLLIAAFGCGSSEPNGGGASSSGGEGDDVTATPACAEGDVRRTETQVCYCGTPSYCGGAAPSAERLEQLSQQLGWQCRPRGSAACEAVLAGEVAAGSPCAEEGEVCDVGGCCHDTVRCIEGAWRDEPGPCPP